SQHTEKRRKWLLSWKKKTSQRKHMEEYGEEATHADVQQLGGSIHVSAASSHLEATHGWSSIQQQQLQRPHGNELTAGEGSTIFYSFSWWD
ncbi:hypothetical protein VIGAN_03184400, partial [Vigna angularis var. angularis]